MTRIYPEGLSYQDKRHIDALDAIRDLLRSELPDEDAGDHISRRARANRNYDIMGARLGDFDQELSRARVEMSELELTPAERSYGAIRAAVLDDLEGRHDSGDDELLEEAVLTVLESLAQMRLVVEGALPISELESEGRWIETLQEQDAERYATWDDERDEITADRARALAAVASIDARLEVLDEIRFQELKSAEQIADEPALDEPHSRGVLGD